MVHNISSTHNLSIALPVDNIDTWLYFTLLRSEMHAAYELYFGEEFSFV